MVHLTRKRLWEVLSLDLVTYRFTWKYDETNPKQRYVGQYAGTKNGNGGLQIAIDGTKYKAHRLVWLYVYDELPAMGIDHRDGNPYNNHPLNLRLATDSQNSKNKKISKNNKTGYKGVYFCEERKKYSASIACDGKRYRLGRFDTCEAAFAAYCSAAKALHQDFARLG